MTIPHSVLAKLNELGKLLDGLHGPTERAFLAYGEVLSRAVTVLRTAGGNLEALGQRLSGDEARATSERLNDAVQQVVALAERRSGKGGTLLSLAAKAQMVAKQVETLRKIVAEVALLAMNGKIQASYLSQSGTDFSVFTVEISRLGDLALETIDKTAGRLVQLRKAIQDAQGETAEFERRNDKELQTVLLRLQHGLKTMADRRDDAARSAVEVAGRSANVAARIAAAIGEMQINDIAAQRVAHVSTALALLAELLREDGRGARAEHHWLETMDEGRIRALAGVVLRLQAEQISRTRQEFCERVGQLATHMHTLARDAGEVSNLAVQTFAGNHAGSASFVGELEQDMGSARDLLRQGDQSRLALKRLMESMAADFSSMAVELQAIQSIDADMRIMGLNATLKCGRLGGRGLALGVIAHELRACSRRTEEQARRLSGALAESMDMAGTLASDADTDLENLSLAACQAMEASLQALGSLGAAIEESFTLLRAGIDQVAGELESTAGQMSIGRDVGAVLERAGAEIHALATEIDPGRSDPREVRREVEMLLHAQYTMDSERLVHGLFDDSVSAGAEAAQAPAAAEDDLDDCFL